MRELSVNEIENVDGGIIPLLWAGYYAAQYIGIAYSGAQIATGVGIAVGFTAAIFAAQD